MRDHLPLPILTYLDGVLVGEEVDDLERVRDNADGQELLAVVAALHHQAKRDPSPFPCPKIQFVCERNAPVNQALNDGHLRLLELLLRVTASGVGEVDGMADLDVVGQGDVLDLNTVEQTDLDKYLYAQSFGMYERTPGCPTCRRA